MGSLLLICLRKLTMLKTALHCIWSIHNSTYLYCTSSHLCSYYKCISYQEQPETAAHTIKSSEQDQYCINSNGPYNTSSWQIWGHSYHICLKKMLRHIIYSFPYVKICPFGEINETRSPRNIDQEFQKLQVTYMYVIWSNNNNLMFYYSSILWNKQLIWHRK